MNCHKEKIIAISNIIHIVLLTVSILSAIVGFLKIFAYAWSLAGLYGEVFIIDNVPVVLPSFLSIGGTNVFYWASGEMNAWGFGLESTLRVVTVVASLFTAERMFKYLKSGESPFSAVVIRWFKYFAWTQFILAFATNVISSMFPIILLVLVYIFEYGGSLQEESDTTL